MIVKSVLPLIFCANLFPAEVLFVEKCLNVLKPGGRLGIVLPRSVVTNSGLEVARRWGAGLPPAAPSKAP